MWPLDIYTIVAHIVLNSILKKKNQASENVGKFHTYLKCRVEYEFITKNQFHNWTSKLASIWDIFRKLGYFWLFLPVQAFCFSHQMLPALYTSNMNEICLHCHWLGFSSFILNFGQCGHVGFRLSYFWNSSTFQIKYKYNVVH